MNERFLYFNGDSFTAGTELADHMLPNHPGYQPYYPDSELSKSHHQKWYLKMIDRTSFLGKIRETLQSNLRIVELQSAYPHLVHKMTGLPYQNDALGGLSMDAIARTSLASLIRLKKCYPLHKIISFISTTGPDRFEVPGENIVTFGKRDAWQSIAQGTSHDSDDLISVKRYYQQWQQNYHSLVNFYKNVILVQQFCTLNEIDLYWIGSWNDFTTWKMDDDCNYPDDLPAFIEYAAFNHHFSMKQLANQRIGEPILCPGGHFSSEIHVALANEITKMLGNK